MVKHSYAQNLQSKFNEKQNFDGKQGYAIRSCFFFFGSHPPKFFLPRTARQMCPPALITQVITHSIAIPFSSFHLDHIHVAQRQHPLSNTLQKLKTLLDDIFAVCCSYQLLHFSVIYLIDGSHIATYCM